MDGERVILARNGDEEELEKIFLEYKKSILKYNKMFYLKGGDSNDLLQEGYIGLMKAIKGYDEKREVSFSHFASVCIKRQIITAIKSYNSSKNLSLNNSSVDEEIDIDYYFKSSTYYSPEEMILGKEFLEGLKKYLDINLTSLEKKVFPYMCQGYTYLETSKRLNEKVKRIDNAICRTKQKIKLYIESYLE